MTRQQHNDPLTDREAIESRRAYVHAFNTTMLDIWLEKIIMLRVIDTKLLLKSLRARRSRRSISDPAYRSAYFDFNFMTYGLFQNWGTGREVSRGNPGDIGRPKVRVTRRWFDRKFYSSSMNIRDFFADSLGREFAGIVSAAFSDSSMRESVTVRR